MRIRVILLAILAITTGCGNNSPNVSGDGNAELAVRNGRNAFPSESNDTTPEAVIAQYYEAINAHDYQKAFSLWGDSGRSSGQSFDEFREGFANTASVEVRIGTRGRIEGAAGSQYVEIPVEIAAETIGGHSERFAGTYTLRRAMVEGATEAQRRWHIYSADIERCPNGCPGLGADSIEVVAVVHAFGERLRNVSVLAPSEQAAGAIRVQYGPLITRDLLDRWIANPAQAPGRQVSSPWPQRIRVSNAQSTDSDRWLVNGSILYTTNADTAEVVEEKTVRIRVDRNPVGGWSIAEFDDGSL